MKDHTTFYRITITCIFNLALSFASVAHAIQNKEMKCPFEKKLKAGYEISEPLQMKDKNGLPSGLDLELLSLVLKEVGCQVEYVELPWTRGVEQLEKGELDILAGASKTPERETFANFSVGYAPRSFTYVYSLKSKVAKYKGLKLLDLKNIANLKIGVGRGYEYGDDFNQAKLESGFESKLQPSNDIESMLKKLAASRVDVAILDELNFNFIAKKLHLLDKLEHTEIVVDSSESYFMFTKKTASPEQITTLNEAIERLKKSKDYKRIIKKYY